LAPTPVRSRPPCRPGSLRHCSDRQPTARAIQRPDPVWSDRPASPPRRPHLPARSAEPCRPVLRWSPRPCSPGAESKLDWLRYRRHCPARLRSSIPKAAQRSEQRIPGLPGWPQQQPPSWRSNWPSPEPRRNSTTMSLPPHRRWLFLVLEERPARRAQRTADWSRRPARPTLGSSRGWPLRAIPPPP